MLFRQVLSRTVLRECFLSISVRGYKTSGDIRLENGMEHIFLMEKQKDYHREFLEHPTANILEAFFYLGNP
jgi:hypothetical protein